MYLDQMQVKLVLTKV